MALTRAQLLSGNSSNGVVLPGQPQGVIAGAGITISATGIISVDASTVTGLVKLNNPLGYNSYVWPNVDGTTGQFLQTDGAGNLTWATAQGYAVVTVQSGAPSPADIGELWFDCATGTLNVYQNCVGTPSPNWFNVSQPGLPVLPANTSAAPPFVSGSGTSAVPYVCNATTVPVSGSAFIVNTVSVGGLAPFQYVPLADLAGVANGGRFTFSNYYADATGTLTFNTIFNDVPGSPVGTVYTANIKIGYGSAYVDAGVTIVAALTTTAGSIAGTPQTGSTLTYTTGVASGGTGPYTYAWIWKDDLGATLQNGGATYVITGTNVGRTISVVLTATDAALAIATATTAPTAIVTTAPFPSGVWNPTPAGGLNTIPGGISASYNGSGPVSSTGCIEISVAGGAYSQGPTPITSGQTLAARWIASSSCGSAATGTNLTGSVTDGTYQTNYAVSVNRKPTPAIANISDTNIGLGAVTTKATAAIAGLTATAYVTLGTGSTGSTIQISKDNVTFVAAPAAPSTSFPINNGDQLYIRQTVGTSTSIGYTAIVAIGDSTGVGGAASTFQTVTYTATTVTSAAFPNTTFSPLAGPNAAPASVNIASDPQLGALKGTATGTWADGNVTLTATNMLLGANAAPTLASITPSNTQTVNFAWLPSYLAPLATGATATGSFTNGTYTNSYTMTVDRNAEFTVPSPTPSGGFGTITIALQTPDEYNVPVKLYQTPDPSNPITSVTVDINGGGPVALPITLATALTLNPGDTVAFSGTVPATLGTYSTDITIGGTTKTWGYTVSSVPAITPPSITSPSDGTTNINPAVNTPAGITLQTTTVYNPTGGAGTPQTSSEWEVYKWVGGGAATPPTSDPPGANYTAVTGSPFTVTSSPFTSVTVPTSAFTVSSTYYARVRYATTNATATTSAWSGWSSFGTASSFLPTPGGAYGGGYFAGQINDGGTIYNLVVAPVTSGALNGQFGGATPATIQWKTSNTGGDTTAQNEVYGAPAMLAYNSATYPMFNWCKNNASGPNAGNYDATNVAGTGIGGYNDWYIPAKNELAVLYFFLKPDTTANNTGSGSNPNSVAPYTPNTNYGPGFPNQTTSTLFQTGGSQAFSAAGYYWSATENSSTTTNAWIQGFNSGGQFTSFLKSNPYYARAVRRIAA